LLLIEEALKEAE